MSRPKRNPSKSKAKTKRDENELALRELALFTQENVGFRLGLAYIESVETRREILDRLKILLADTPVDLTIVNLGDFPGEQSLLHRLQAHLAEHPAPEGKSSAVMVIGLEALLDYREVHEYQPAPQMILRNANWHRELFRERSPCPVVIWLLPTAARIFALEAPDLWHWRSGIFHFPGKPGGRQKLEDELVTVPLHRTDSLPRAEKGDRIALLNELLAQLQNADDYETKGNKARRANILMQLGLAYRSISDAQQAKTYYEDALALYRVIGDRREEGIALGNLGIAYMDLGEAAKAIGVHEQALSILRETGDRRGEGNALGSLGIANAVLGQPAKAIGYFEQHLTIAREIGDRHSEGGALDCLGNAYYALGETAKAIGYYEEALTINRQIGNHNGEGATLGNLGNAYSDRGQTEKAIGFYEQALTIAREVGDRRGEGNDLGNLGLAYAALGQTKKAVGLVEEALKIGQEIQDPGIIASNTERLKQLRGEGTD